MVIKVLGMGCPSCKRLFENAKEAVAITNKKIEVLYVTDIKEIMATGVMKMPAIIINDKIVSNGNVLTTNEIVNIINSISK